MQGGSGARRRQSPLRSDAPGQTHGPRSPLGVCLELPPFSPTVASCSGAGARPRGRSVHSVPQSPRRGGKRQKTKTEEKESALGDQLALRSRLPNPVQRGGPGAGPRPGPVLSCPVQLHATPPAGPWAATLQLSTGRARGGREGPRLPGCADRPGAGDGGVGGFPGVGEVGER